MKNQRQWYVYFLIHQKKIVYIGMSGSMQSRIVSHLQDKDFTSVRWIVCKSKYKAARYERRWILKFMPKYNTDYLLTLKRQKTGILKRHLPATTVDLLQALCVENEVSMDDVLRSPLIDSLYEYEKYQKPKRNEHRTSLPKRNH